MAASKQRLRPLSATPRSTLHGVLSATLGHSPLARGGATAARRGAALQRTTSYTPLTTGGAHSSVLSAKYHPLRSLRATTQLHRGSPQQPVAQGMGGTQSTDVGQPSKLSAPLPSLRWELQSRPKGLVKIDDFRLIEEVHAQPTPLCTCSERSEQHMAQVTPRLTLHSITPHTPHATPRAAYTAGDRLLAARGR